MLQNMLKMMKVLTFNTSIKHSRHCINRMFHFHGIYNLTPQGRASQEYQFHPSVKSAYGIPKRVNLDCVVGIFWDVDKELLPKKSPPFEAAIRLTKMAQEYGLLKYKTAYANRDAFDYVPVEVKQKRPGRDKWMKLKNGEFKKQVMPTECRMCGRRFYNIDKLLHHFSVIHERDHEKWVRRIEGARGSKRVELVGRFSYGMKSYKFAAREILNLKVGYSLALELKKAGYWVREVSNEPRAVFAMMRDHIMKMMDNKAIGCLILVSHNPDFVELLKEAKLRGVKTVVIAHSNQGDIKRFADASFSWKDIAKGKSQKEAMCVIGKWKQREVLEKLEWTYHPKTDGKRKYPEIDSDMESEDDASLQKENSPFWWEL